MKTLTLTWLFTPLILLNCTKLMPNSSEGSFIDQALDTIDTYDNYYLIDPVIIKEIDYKADETTSSVKRDVAPVNIYIDGDHLYIANLRNADNDKNIEAIQRVDRFDLETMQYQRSYSYNGRTLAEDMCVLDDKLYIAAGNSCEVQIFDKNTGEYLSRLGTGVYTGWVSWSKAIASSKKLIFIWDSRPEGIRVFNTDNIDFTAINNNKPFLNLDIERVITNRNHRYDISVIGDSLYAFVHDKDPALLYVYYIPDIENKKTEYAKKIELPEKMGIYSVSLRQSTNVVYLSMKIDDKPIIRGYKLKDYLARRWDKFIFSINTRLNTLLPSQPFLGNYEDKIIFYEKDQIEFWTLENIPIHIFKPI